MQLRLPGTSDRVGPKMRYIDEGAPRLRTGGLICAEWPNYEICRLLPVGEPHAVIVDELIVRRILVDDLQLVQQTVISSAALRQTDDDAV
jgi:hypothetical protein